MKITCAVSGQVLFQSTFLLCLRSTRLPGPTPRKPFPVFLSQGHCPFIVRGAGRGWVLKQPVHLLLRTTGAASFLNRLPVHLLQGLGLRLGNRRDARRDCVRTRPSAPRLTLSNPLTPPCRLLGPLLMASLYSFPSNVNVPLAIRLATLPTTAPK